MALRLISGVEQQLQEVNDCIYKLEFDQTKVMAPQNQSLHDDLVGCAASLVSASLNINPVTIGLTTEDSIECSVKRGVVKCSRNRLRKYKKLKRYVNNTKKKLFNIQKSIHKNFKFSKDRIQLIEKLETCHSIIIENMTTYKENIDMIISKINNRQKSLVKMTINYHSKKEIGEYILALKCLLITSVSEGTQIDSFSLVLGLDSREKQHKQSVYEPLNSHTINLLRIIIFLFYKRELSSLYIIYSLENLLEKYLKK
ncbi:unnamed protein product [Diatraea saccharalis]|uniref:Uncharacterized protein n=1 Tax=Diatraea saccharalis TaxID=40085 RepID=A0A9N9QVS7_9NEOP|nr:unnamed protein product [Diatraea saccharalis]